MLFEVFPTSFQDVLCQVYWILMDSVFIRLSRKLAMLAEVPHALATNILGLGEAYVVRSQG